MSDCEGPTCTHSSHAKETNAPSSVIPIKGEEGKVILFGLDAASAGNRHILRSVSLETTLEEVKRLDLPARLKHAMDHAWTPAVGISAVQIGVLLRFGIYFRNWGGPTDQTNPVFLINPTIVERSAELVPYTKEGCLSIVDYRPSTWRHSAVQYMHVVNGKLTQSMALGIEAFIIQHEVDHMNGTLCIDRVSKPLTPGRNEQCPCGSHKKFKRCCGAA